MNINNDNLIKISERIVKESIEVKYKGTDNIQLTGNIITFSEIEFDSKFILSEGSIICSKNDKYPSLEHTIYSIIGKGKYEENPTTEFKINEIDGFEFYSCRFTNDVYFNMSDKDILLIEHCIFEKDFYINKNPHPQEDNNKNVKINQLEMNKCIFKNNFLIESCEISNYRIIDIEFEGNVKFFNVELYDMHKNADAEESGWFTNSIFYKSAIFEKVKFKKFIQFKYTTFENYTLFRDILFDEGLDLDYANIEKEINFFGIEGLDSKASKKNTSRETYRAIKKSFDKIGNHIEANKYFSLEMKKHKVELKDKPIKGYLQEKSIFWINEKMSNFGQSFMRPIGLIVFFSIMYGLIIYGNEHHWLMNINPNWSEALNSFMHWLNYPFKEFKPLEKILKKDYEVMSLIFNIIFSVLTWQTIVAVKRYTKR